MQQDRVKLIRQHISWEEQGFLTVTFFTLFWRRTYQMHLQSRDISSTTSTLILPSASVGRAFPDTKFNIDLSNRLIYMPSTLRALYDRAVSTA